MGLQQTSPTGAGWKIALKVMLIDSVTLSDGYSSGERAPTADMGGLGAPALCGLGRA